MHDRLDQEYSRERARQCRAMAEKAASPVVRAIHLELARLHAFRSGGNAGPIV